MKNVEAKKKFCKTPKNILKSNIYLNMNYFVSGKVDLELDIAKVIIFIFCRFENKLKFLKTILDNYVLGKSFIAS